MSEPGPQGGGQPLSSSVYRATSLFFAAGHSAGLGLVVWGYTRSAEPAWGRVLITWGAAIAVIFGAGLFLRLERRLSLLSSLVAIGFAVFAFNAYLVIRGPAYLHLIAQADALRARVPGYDPRTVFQVAEERTKAGQPTVPFLTGHMARLAVGPDPKILPLAGAASSTTALCREPGPYVLYAADEYGFRNSPGLHHRADVLLMGDSFAHGECVFPGQEVSGILRSRGHQVVSLGMSGTGPLIQLAILKEYGLRLKPKTVVWFFFEENDFLDLREELGVPLLVRYWTEEGFTQRLTERRDEVEAFWAAYLKEKQGTGGGGAQRGVDLGAVASLRAVRQVFGLSRDAYWPWRAPYVGIMKQAKALIEAEGGQLHLVYLPGWARYGTRPAVDKAEVLDAMGEIGAPVVDFDEVLQGAGDPLDFFPFRMVGHYDEKGHALLADTVESRILRAP